VVRGTTNPAPCCHVANDTDLLTPVVWAMAGDNKQIDLWPELTQNLIRSSHGHSTPSLIISCKSVQPFSRNVLTKKQRNRPKTIPRPPTGGGVINTFVECYTRSYIGAIFQYLLLTSSVDAALNVACRLYWIQCTNINREFIWSEDRSQDVIRLSRTWTKRNIEPSFSLKLFLPPSLPTRISWWADMYA